MKYSLFSPPTGHRSLCKTGDSAIETVFEMAMYTVY